MRLLNVDTLELKTFYNRKKRPPYAILSHTWDDNEISFEDMKSLHTVRGLAGFSKVEGCCRIARERGHQWVWIVTLCIDKSSSSELSEAINSMFRWYKEAKECYAYLVDVDWFRPNSFSFGSAKNYPDEDVFGPYHDAFLPFQDVFSAFSRSRWFTRGWTLQELIAPEFLLFYSQDWKLISERHAIAADLAYITSIHKKFLSRHTLHDLGEASTAEKMSWASGRETEREEDMSYCLMGLFGVNMPLLYGEGGERAFLRLQEEILKRSEDHTIFCWNARIGSHDSVENYPLRGLLAESVQRFSGGSVLFICEASRDAHEMTNIGLRITLPLIYRNVEDPQAGYVAITNSSVSFPKNWGVFELSKSIRIGIPLE